MRRNIELEVCIEHPPDGILAQAAGATRIEINAALGLSGLTPSLSACRWLRTRCTLPIIAMVRPRDTFMLNETDQQIALEDAAALLELGIDGVAYGALRANGELDLQSIRQMVELCAPRALVVHRAFDHVTDQQRGLEQLIDCGVRRILTSGGAPTALQGMDRLRQLMMWSRGRIEILPAGGLTAANVQTLLDATGCTQVHGSFRQDATEIAAVRKVLYV